jgi:hypothetical protein
MIGASSSSSSDAQPQPSHSSAGPPGKPRQDKQGYVFDAAGVKIGRISEIYGPTTVSICIACMPHKDGQRCMKSVGSEKVPSTAKLIEWICSGRSCNSKAEHQATFFAITGIEPPQARPAKKART